MLLGLVI